MNPACPFDLVIGLDRSDKKADLYLIHLPSGKTEQQSEVLHQELGWMNELVRAKRPKRVPTVMSKEETQRVLAGTRRRHRSRQACQIHSAEKGPETHG